ncbi:hypothetical protein [Yersinia mollaretii]|uniref:hypothetical protein n=1 Tax=Yersinia mollaretii TaxID=33060 RepID=UPI0011A04AE7|nr:hypothetical protein [Yersinia mollaretii]
MIPERRDDVRRIAHTVCHAASELPLSALLTERCNQFANSPKAVKIIDSGIEKMLTDMVNDVFRADGNFGKQLTEVFKAALPTNIATIVDLQRYNSLVIQSIREAWDSSRIEGSLVERMTDLVTEFTREGAIPKYVLASDLWAAFLEENNARAIEERWRKPQVIISQFENGDYIWIGLHPEQSSPKHYYGGVKNSAHECDFMLAFSAKYHCEHDTKIPVMRENKPVYELFAGHLDRGTLGKTVLNAYSQFDKLVLALYYGGSLLLWDKNPKDIHYPGDN